MRCVLIGAKENMISMHRRSARHLKRAGREMEILSTELLTQKYEQALKDNHGGLQTLSNENLQTDPDGKRVWEGRTS